MSEHAKAKGSLGFFVGQREGRLVVADTIRGSPAHRAGLQRGDFLVRIDDEWTEGLSRKVAAERLRGWAGEPVTVWVERPDASGMLRFDLVREPATKESLPKLLLPIVAPLLVIATVVLLAKACTAESRDTVNDYVTLLREQRFEEAYALMDPEAGLSFEAWKDTLDAARLDRADDFVIASVARIGGGRGCVSASVEAEGKRIGVTFFTKTTSSGTRIHEVLTNRQLSGWFQKGPWQCD